MIWIFILGLAGLVAGAELLVRGAGKLALSMGISPLVVGLTVVSFGTSAPELAVSLGAVLDGRTDIAMGNVVGSNIFNVLFILGLSALVTPLVVGKQLIRQEVPILVGVSLLLIVLGMDGRVSFTDSLLLSGLLFVYTAFVVIQSRRHNAQDASAGNAQDIAADGTRGWDSHWIVQLLLIAAGLALLVLGSRGLVSASVAFAQALGVSDVIIGLTIVAAGTSMPEVATSVMAAIRKESDIAVGNAVGSCVFNILGCLGVAGLFASAPGLSVAPSILNFDAWVMLAAAFACVPVFITGRYIARWEGAVFLGYYIAYTAYLIMAAQEHDALEAYSTIMMSFALPLTIVTVVAVMIRPGSRRTT
jgi:cation:H+ antiporter